MHIFALYRSFNRRFVSRVLDRDEVQRCLSEGGSDTDIIAAIARSIAMEPA